MTYKKINDISKIIDEKYYQSKIDNLGLTVSQISKKEKETLMDIESRDFKTLFLEKIKPIVSSCK